MRKQKSTLMLYLPEQLKEELRRLSQKKGLSMSTLIKMMICEAIEEDADSKKDK